MTLVAEFSRSSPRRCGLAELRQQIGEAPRRRTRIGTHDQRQLGVAEFWKPLLRPQSAMYGEEGDVRQDADAEADRNGGLNAGQVGARIGDTPGAPGGLEQMDGPPAVKAALFEDGERQGITAVVDRKPFADHPAE